LTFCRWLSAGVEWCSMKFSMILISIGCQLLVMGWATWNIIFVISKNLKFYGIFHRVLNQEYIQIFTYFSCFLLTLFAVDFNAIDGIREKEILAPSFYSFSYTSYHVSYSSQKSNNSHSSFLIIFYLDVMLVVVLFMQHAIVIQNLSRRKFHQL
jgi:hypothetical protein